MNRLLVFAMVAVLFMPIVAFAQSANEKLNQGIRSYEELELETAIMLLNEALRLGLPKPSQIEAYKHLGFCYIDTDRSADTQKAFESLLKLNSAYELDSSLPPKYLNAFSSVKSAMPKMGSISVKSEPPSAQVILDNVIQNKRTPMTITDVMAGKHSLKLTLKGYEDWEQMVSVEANKTLELNKRLIEVLPPQPQQKPIPTVKKGSNLPWLIIGGAIVAGGGIAAAVLLSGSGDDEFDDNGNGDGIYLIPQTAPLTISLRLQ